MIAVIAVLAFALPGASARADDTLALEGPVDRQAVSYDCRASEDAEPERIDVEYINTPHNNLAILPIDGHPTVFVTTIAVAGAKYVSGEMVWWTRGNRGNLYSEMRNDASETTVCRVARD